MVPELSRSADHLCQQRINEEGDENDMNNLSNCYKDNLLKTPDYTSKGYIGLENTQNNVK
jgi:hypothetical protein